MKILVLGINYAPELVGIGPYTAGMAEFLVEAGHEVEVITTNPYYPQWRVADGFRRRGYRRERRGGVSLVRCPIYVPSRPSGSRRIAHHASFAASAAPHILAAARRFRPDVVMAIAPSLLGAPLAKVAARLCGARTWLHIQDFEVEAAFATGLMEQGGRLARLALGFQARALSGFDIVSSISPQMCAKLVDLGVPAECVVEFRNWSDVSRITVLGTPSPYRAEWEIAQPHVVLYSGNIANKQGIGIVVEAARLLRGRSDILFLICGEGPQRQQLMDDAAGLANVRFVGFQPADRLGELLGLADVHLLPQLAGAADLVLPSKLTNMLASGRPVIATAEPGTGLAEEVAEAGLVTPPGDAPALAAAIERLIDDPDHRDRLGRAARERAERRWSRAAILSAFERRLAGLAAGRRA